MPERPPGYHIVRNLKEAAMLAAMGVPLVAPHVTRTRQMVKGKPQEVIGFFFAEHSLTGIQTQKLMRAWDHPELYTEAVEPFGLVPILKAALDNRDEWVATAKRLDEKLRVFAAGNPSLEECEIQLREAAKLIVPKILTRRGKSFSILRANAPKEEVELVANKLREVAG